MSHYLFLDSGPLGLLTQPREIGPVLEVNQWLSRCILSGARIIVPAIVYYELKRELLRANKTIGVDRLEDFVKVSPGRYLPLTDEALRLAAELWARARQLGRPTAEPNALDIDVLIAAQALTFGASASDVVIVTTNPKHLSQFIAARHWNDIQI